VVRKQVHLVHVEHAPVSGVKETGTEALPSLGERGAQVEGAHQAILRGPHRQLHEGRPLAQQGSHAPRQRRLAAALLAPQEHAAHPGVDRVEKERQLDVVLAHDGA